MKKIITLLLCLVLTLTLFVGCGSEQNTADADSEIKIVTTIFPIYDWTMNMIGDDADKFDVSMLIDNGVDMHSYQATTADMVSIHTCDVFIYVGGESDGWIEDLLATTTNTDMIVINLVDVLGDSVVFEELVEGMEATEHSHDHDDEDHDHEEECTDEDCDHDHDEEECTDEDCDHDHEEECTDEDCCDHDHEDEHVHDEDCDHDHDHEEECTDEDCDHDHDHEDEDCCEEEIDEHVWLSLANAQEICAVIASTLASLDSDNASVYSSNLASYVADLQALDSKYAEMVASASRDTVLFADRFPFRYLVDDYNLNYYAAFAGCSSETEASFETIVFLAGKVDELGIETILTVEGVAHKIAETVILATENQNQTILALNSMETVTSADIQNGTTYLSIMEENLEIFKLALN